MAKEKKPIDTSPLSFDLAVVSIPVKVGGKQYTMKEASSGTATAYKNMVINNTKMGPDGKPQSMKNVADAEPFLVSKCLWDSNNKNPDLYEVREWPSRVTTQLFEKIKEISGMDQDDEMDADEGKK